MDNEKDFDRTIALPEMATADVAVSFRQLAEEEWDRDDTLSDADIEADIDADDDADEGSGTFIRYNRAFIAKMSLAADNLKAYYNVLKNALLSYKGVKSRISWCFDSFNCGRHQLAKINVRGNGLIVYLALDSTQYAGTKYRYRDVGYKKKFADVPMQIKIKSKRGLRYALELTADIMRGLGIKAGEVKEIAYAPQRESVEMLMRRNLVRVVNQGAVAVEKEEVAADIVVPAPAAQEIVPDIPAVPVAINAAVAAATLSDTDARAAIAVRKDKKRKGHKKVMINIDVIGRNFRAGDEVTIDALVAKRLISPQCGYLIVCARGSLDKPLIIKANDFSLNAVKMIVLTGGQAIRVKGD